MRGGARFLATWLWSRRLTEPPRPANMCRSFKQEPEAMRTNKPPLKGEVPAIGGRRGSFPAPHGRGGSVSRRDLTQAYRRHTQPTGGTNSEASYQAKRQPLFGSRGSGGRGASLREAASPPRISPPPSLHDFCPCGGVVAGLGEAPAVRNGERRFGVAESNA